MARIDAYLRSLERFGAKAIVLKSGQHVTLRFDSGDRHATQTTSHEQIVDLVKEILPASARESISKLPWVLTRTSNRRMADHLSEKLSELGALVRIEPTQL